MKNKTRPKVASPERIQECIDDAIVDAYGMEEQLTGFYTVITDYVACPFKAKVIGEVVEITGFDFNESDLGFNALCKYKNKVYPIDILSVEWVEPYPEGFEWIEAYFQWL